MKRKEYTITFIRHPRTNRMCLFLKHEKKNEYYLAVTLSKSKYISEEEYERIVEFIKK